MADDRTAQESDALRRVIADRKALGDVTTMADPAVVATLRKQYEEKEG